MVCLHLGVGLGFPAKHCPEWLFQIMQVPNLSALTPKHCSSPTDVSSCASHVLSQLWATGRGGCPPVRTAPRSSWLYSSTEREISRAWWKNVPRKGTCLFLIVDTRKLWICFISITQKQLTLRLWIPRPRGRGYQSTGGAAELWATLATAHKQAAVFQTFLLACLLKAKDCKMES